MKPLSAATLRRRVPGPHRDPGSSEFIRGDATPLRSPVRSRPVMGFMLLLAMLAGCDSSSRPEPESSTGVKKTDAVVKPQASGLTVEQENIRRRLQMENLPGTLKHLYVISAMSGDVILYSTVKGKVTSSGKRLSPYEIKTGSSGREGFPIYFGDRRYYTTEVLQDDGSYGSSIPYLYWWDTRDVYHQHYVTGGQIVHLSDQPIAVPKVILNLETVEPERAEN